MTTPNTGIQKAFFELVAVPDPPMPSVCCHRCGGGNRSALAADPLRKLGHTESASLRVGFGAWQEAGLASVRETPAGDASI